MRWMFGRHKTMPERDQGSPTAGGEVDPDQGTPITGGEVDRGGVAAWRRAGLLRLTILRPRVLSGRIRTLPDLAGTRPLLRRGGTTVVERGAGIGSAGRISGLITLPASSARAAALVPRRARRRPRRAEATVAEAARVMPIRRRARVLSGDAPSRPSQVLTKATDAYLGKPRADATPYTSSPWLRMVHSYRPPWLADEPSDDAPMPDPETGTWSSTAVYAPPRAAPATPTPAQPHRANLAESRRLGLGPPIKAQVHDATTPETGSSENRTEADDEPEVRPETAQAEPRAEAARAEPELGLEAESRADGQAGSEVRLEAESPAETAQATWHAAAARAGSGASPEAELHTEAARTKPVLRPKAEPEVGPKAQLRAAVAPRPTLRMIGLGPRDASPPAIARHPRQTAASETAQSTEPPTAESSPLPRIVAPAYRAQRSALVVPLRVRTPRTRPHAQPVPRELADAFGRIHKFDVSSTTVRRGPEATVQAESLQAKAFTQQAEVYLPQEAGPLDQQDVRALLAHELTHVAQQQMWGSALPDEDSEAGRVLESEAVATEQWALGRSEPPPPLARTRRDSQPTPDVLSASMLIPSAWQFTADGPAWLSPDTRAASDLAERPQPAPPPATPQPTRSPVGASSLARLFPSSDPSLAAPQPAPSPVTDPAFAPPFPISASSPGPPQWVSLPAGISSAVPESKFASAPAASASFRAHQRSAMAITPSTAPPPSPPPPTALAISLTAPPPQPTPAAPPIPPTEPPTQLTQPTFTVPPTLATPQATWQPAALPVPPQVPETPPPLLPQETQAAQPAPAPALTPNPDPDLAAIRDRLLDLAWQKPLDLDDPDAVERFTDDLYRRVHDRLRHDLLIGRERAGLLSDFR
jgi:uncharacterized protein DUF4157